VVRVRDRDAAMAALKARGIAHAVYYPVPLHLQACLGDRAGRPGEYPAAEAACEDVLALPIFPGLTDDEQDAVVDALAAAHKEATCASS